MESSHPTSVPEAYALGLWCADGYWWSSSIGLSTTEPMLAMRFAAYLESFLSRRRLRLRVYVPKGAEIDVQVTALVDQVAVRPSFKMKKVAYQIYVNSRPLLRRMRELRDGLEQLPAQLVGPYFAGRFDGDGCFGTRRVPGSRIVYTTADEAATDAVLLSRAGIEDVAQYWYRDAAVACLYVRSAETRAFEALIAAHSWKAANRRMSSV